MNLRQKVSGNHFVTLRSATPDDKPFLRQLFATTRTAELALMPLNENQKETFITMQFEAQSSQYMMAYPAAAHSIILRENEPVGRIMVSRNDALFSLVDIALLPQHRNAGIGTIVIQDLLNEASALGKAVQLHVVTSNPAIHLYERLGFVRTSADSVYADMMWVPANSGPEGLNNNLR